VWHNGDPKRGYIRFLVHDNTIPFNITGLLKKPDKGNVPSSGFLRYG
jgi:hypothetical protein